MDTHCQPGHTSGKLWEGPSRQKKKTKRDSKEINKLFREQQEELDQLLYEGSTAKDLNFKTYKLKDIINGPKIKSADTTCINDPVSGELITNRETIKKISLDHCVKVNIKEQDKGKRQGRTEAQNREP